MMGDTGGLEVVVVVVVVAVRTSAALHTARLRDGDCDDP